MLLKGCVGYLASIVDTMKKVLTGLPDVHMVCKFPDVFSKELSGLPLDREIEFEIELLPRMATISKALCQMAPVELKELKKKMQD